LENILNESLNLFLKFGIRSVSMDDIAKELAISKKTLYQFVENKADLIDKILNFRTDESCDLLIGIADSEQNAIDILLEISKQVSKSYQESTPGMHFDMQKYYPEIYKKHVEKHKGIVYNGIIQNIKIGKEQGIYRDDLKADLIAQLYIKKLIEMNDEEFLNNIPYSFKKIFETMFDSHIRAIVNEKGLEYYLERKKSLKFKV
jgi:AcrR family transcriptional regulator